MISFNLNHLQIQAQPESQRNMPSGENIGQSHTQPIGHPSRQFQNQGLVSLSRRGPQQQSGQIQNSWSGTQTHFWPCYLSLICSQQCTMCTTSRGLEKSQEVSGVPEDTSNDTHSLQSRPEPTAKCGYDENPLPSVQLLY